jgi:conserved oligomeric Golgi complex subunit 2
LKGGDERVEEVRVGLLGFRKEVESLRSAVVEREEEVQKLVEERRRIGAQVAVGRRLVEYEARLRGLEELLVIETTGKERPASGRDEVVSDSEEESDEEDDDDDGTMGVSVAKLRRNVLQYRVVQELEKGLDEHPFVAAQTPRIMKVRNTLLLDLSTALQQAKAAGPVGADKVMKVMKIYVDMDESMEAVKVLKSLKA